MEIKELKTSLEKKVLSTEKTIIVPHREIDFDAIGASIGVSLVCKKLDKKPYILITDPLYRIDHGVQLIIDDIKDNFNIINKDNYNEIKNDNDLLLLVDFNKKTLCDVNSKLKNPDNVFIIDHHEDDEYLSVKANNKYIDTSISSASEIVCSLLSTYKIKLNNKLANYILAGIYLDTNKLTKNVTSQTMKTVAYLLENGANINEVIELFAEDFNSDRRVQELVSKAKILTYSVALVLADEENEYTKEEIAKAADYLLKFNVDASYAIGNIGEDTISLSARSKEKINVGNIMKELGGGGNQYSGATRIKDTTIEETSQKLLKLINPPYYVK